MHWHELPSMQLHEYTCEITGSHSADQLSHQISEFVIIDVSKQRTALLFRVNNPVIQHDNLEDLDPEYAYHVNRMRQ
jgi:hypothetical protein